MKGENLSDNDNHRALPSVIRINVGGVHYETLLATLCGEESMLSSMFSGKHNLERDQDGCPFIDRPGEPFEHILNFLRDKSTMPPNNLSMQVYKEALYYQIQTLIKRLENTPGIFRFRLQEATKNKLKNFDFIKENVIQKAQKKSEENLTQVATVGLITSSEKKKLDDPIECVLNEHLLSVECEGNCKQEKFGQTKRRLEAADIIIDDDGSNINMKLLMEILEKDLQSDGYKCKIWSEKRKCLYRSNYTHRECRFEIIEYFAEFEWI
ncbi:BTB/POZ domain-containing protein KCTD7-like isoform X2 [Dendronephthya gigantea]|nr:BTB/POZ domain-containing protein KCTD7-like isoform X2 [Dendronephthya gigantea]